MALNKTTISQFINFLRARGFIAQRSLENVNNVVFDHGPLGALLKQNIFNQWWNSLNKTDSNVFLIECSPISNVCDVTSSYADTRRYPNAPVVITRDSLQNDCLRHYPDILQVTEGHLPFSVAAAGLCTSSSVAAAGLCTSSLSSDASAEKHQLLGSLTQTDLLLQSYVPPSTSGSHLDYWSQHFLSWWKRFARYPSSFSLDTRSEVNGGTDIVFEFPWGRECVQQIRNTGDAFFRGLQEEGDIDYKAKTHGDKRCLPHCIECRTSVELVAAALLVDGYSERASLAPADGMTGKTNTVLQLHHELAPYQVAVMRESSTSPLNSSYLHQIPHLCNNLVKQLRSKGLSVLNAPHHGDTREAHLAKNDQLGIFDTVIFNPDTLNNGIVILRNRDTEIESEMHITQVADHLSLKSTGFKFAEQTVLLHHES